MEMRLNDIRVEVSFHPGEAVIVDTNQKDLMENLMDRIKDTFDYFVEDKKLGGGILLLEVVSRVSGESKSDTDHDERRFNGESSIETTFEFGTKSTEVAENQS